jgi:naphtho-gamma-pyrone polyketide synthase
VYFLSVMLTVLGKLREILDVELDGRLFQDNNSLDEVEAALGLKARPAAITPHGHAPTRDIIKVGSHPPAISIVLQGNAKTASKTLFFPDGSGSATSYAPLPKISPDMVGYGLNCPSMKNPQDMKCSLDKLTPSYLHEVRRRQPHGPY